MEAPCIGTALHRGTLELQRGLRATPAQHHSKTRFSEFATVYRPSLYRSGPALKDLQYPLAAACFQYPNGRERQSLLAHSPDALITGLAFFLAAFVVMVHGLRIRLKINGARGLTLWIDKRTIRLQLNSL